MTYSASKKMHQPKKLKRNINNSLKNFILIEKMEMLKNSNNSMKHIKHLVIHNKEEIMINMVLKEPKDHKDMMILWICSSVEEEEVEEEQEDVNKFLKLNLLKKHSQSLCKIFIMVKLWNLKIPELDAVKNVKVKVDKMFKNVSNVKEKVWLFKCIKWVQECINKYKNIVINVKEKVKSSLKEANANNVMDKKFLKKPKLLKFQFKKVFQIIIQLLFQVKVTKFPMQWLETWF